METQENNNIYDLEKSILDNIKSKLTKKLDDLIIQGLKLKGFEFKNQIELQDFVKEKCKTIEAKDSSYTIYLVNDIPFLFHYKPETFPQITFEGTEIKSDLGEFSFL